MFWAQLPVKCLHVQINERLKGRNEQNRNVGKNISDIINNPI